MRLGVAVNRFANIAIPTPLHFFVRPDRRCYDGTSCTSSKAARHARGRGRICTERVLYVIREDSRARARWDLLAMTLAVASCLLVTYQLAFQHRAHLFGTLVVYLIDAFFLADIAVNFRTSYRQHGLDITDEDRISRRYRRSVFAFDALAAVPWDAALLPWAGAELGGVSIVLWARLLRMLRVMRLFVILLGASIWAFFIGNIASLLSNLDSTKSLFWGRVESVMQFLRSRQVPQDVREDVQDCYEYIWGRYRGTSGQSLLADLPAPLRIEVMTHLAGEVLERLPLFRHSSPVFRN